MKRLPPSRATLAVTLAVLVLACIAPATSAEAAAGGSSDGRPSACGMRVAAGDHHSLMIKSDGSLWSCGLNYHGELGLGAIDGDPHTTPVRVGAFTDWTAMACGLAFNMALRGDGSLWAWGFNSFGQLGLDDAGTDYLVPTRVGTATDWTTVTCGVYHTMALRSDGSLWVWGNNDIGQLGLGDRVARSAPVRMGTDTWRAVAGGVFHTVAVRSDGSLWAWGYNQDGQLGDGMTASRSSPARIGTATDWTAVACGAYHSVALRSDGSLWAWGSNGMGQLGLGSRDWNPHPAPVHVGPCTDWTAVKCGYYHTVALRSDGSLWAWGDNAYGELGLGAGDAGPHSSPARIDKAKTWAAVVCGFQHNLALRRSLSFWAWGLNFDGQLGDDTTTDRGSPVRVMKRLCRATVTATEARPMAASHAGQYGWFNVMDYGAHGDGIHDDTDAINATIEAAVGWRWRGDEGDNSLR